MSKFLKVCKNINFNKNNSIDKALFLVYRAYRSINAQFLVSDDYIKISCFKCKDIDSRQYFGRIHRDHNQKYVLTSECDRIKVCPDLSKCIVIAGNTMMIPIISDEFTYIRIAINKSKMREFIKNYSNNAAIKNLYDLYENI